MIKGKSHLLAFSFRFADYTFKFHQRQFDLTLCGKPVYSWSAPSSSWTFYSSSPPPQPLHPSHTFLFMRCLWHHIKCSTALWKTWKGGKEVEEITAVNDETLLASSPCPPVSHGGVSEWQSIKRKSTKPWLTRLCTQRSPNLHLTVSCKPHPGSLGDSTMLTVTSLLVWLCVCLCVCVLENEGVRVCVCMCVRACKSKSQ